MEDDDGAVSPLSKKLIDQMLSLNRWRSKGTAAAAAAAAAQTIATADSASPNNARQHEPNKSWLNFFH